MPVGKRGGRQRLVRDPAGGGRRDAGAGRGAGLRLAVVLDLPARWPPCRAPRAITVPLTEAGEHDLEAMAARGDRRHPARDRLQPEQPDAPRRSPPATIDAWVAELPRHVAVILDEAYVEFYALQDPDDSLDLLERHPNLVLLRTFSKVYGLCGLRAGLRARPRGVPARGRPRAPALLGQRARAGRRRRGASATRTRSSGAWSRTSIERVHVESELGGARPGHDRQPGQLLLGRARRPRRGRDRRRPGARRA